MSHTPRDPEKHRDPEKSIQPPPAAHTRGHAHAEKRENVRFPHHVRQESRLWSETDYEKHDEFEGVDLNEVYSNLLGSHTSVASESKVFLLFDITALVALAVSAILIGFTNSYENAYFNPNGAITEEQGKLTDISKSSRWTAAASIVFVLVAVMIEYSCQRSRITKAVAAHTSRLEGSQTSGHRRATRSKESGASMGRLRLLLWTVVALILTIIFIYHASKMWRDGTNPKVKVLVKVKKKGGGVKKIRRKERKSCKAAEFSHCDKIEAIGEALIAASVTHALVLLLIGGMWVKSWPATKS